MTSQKSSVNKQAAKFDFKFSFKAIIAPSVLTFIIASILFILQPLSQYLEYKNSRGTEYTADILNNSLSMFSTLDSTGRVGLNIFAVAGGVLFAFSAFKFLSRKKSVNFFLATGVNRCTLFINRVLSSAIMMALCIGVPLIVDTIMNIAIRGHAGHMAEFGFFAFLNLFSAFFAGFSIMSIAMCLSCTVFDALITGFSFVVAPYALIYGIEFMMETLLRGYDSNGDFLYKISTFTPLFCNVKLGDGFNGNSIFYAINQAKENLLDGDDYYLPVDGTFLVTGKYTHIGYKYFVGALVWLAVGVILLIVANYCLKKRKAENTSIIRRSTVSAIMVSLVAGLSAICIVVAVVYSMIDLYNIPSVLTALILGIIFFLVSSIVQLIARGNIKKPKTYLLYSAIGTVVPLVFALVLSFGAFGYTTYVPQLDEVESCKVMSSDMDSSFGDSLDNSSISNFGDFFHIYNFNQGELGIFTNKADIERVLRVAKSAGEKKSDGPRAVVSFEYKLKNGKTVTRNFVDVADETVAELAGLTATEEMQNQVENYFLNGTDATTYAEEEYYHQLEIGEKSVDTSLKGALAYAYAPDGKRFKIENTEAFRKALLKDVKRVGYSKEFSSEKELFAIAFSYPPSIDEDSGEAEAETAFVGYGIYDDMTNVLNYLKKNTDVINKLNSHDVTKDIKSVTVVNIKKATKEEGISKYRCRFVGCINATPFYLDPDNLFDSKKYGKTYTDRADISRYLESGCTFGYSNNDDDCVLVIEHKSGEMGYRLLRAKNA